MPEVLTSDDLAKEDVSWRLTIFGSLIMVGCGLLIVAAMVLHWRKNRQWTIGPWAMRSDGCFWNGKPLCCARPKSHYQAVEALVDQSAAKESGDVGGTQQTSGLNAASPEQERVWVEEDEPMKEETFGVFRKVLLVVLYTVYVSSCLWLPLSRVASVSCVNGFFWETHMHFLAVFLVVKSIELGLYYTDTTTEKERELSIASFLFKFGSSFLGFVDGYTDCTSVVIAHACPGTLAQRLSIMMGVTYLAGVVFLQWVMVAWYAFQDPSGACFMKLLHMDALAASTGPPEGHARTWKCLHVARTIGEDIPQAILQTIYTVKVKKNYFVILSICVGVGASAKATWDACNFVAKRYGRWIAPPPEPPEPPEPTRNPWRPFTQEHSEAIRKFGEIVRNARRTTAAAAAQEFYGGSFGGIPESTRPP